MNYREIPVSPQEDELMSALPHGLIRRLATLQREINIEMSALTPEQRAQRAKANLIQMPGQAYLFQPLDAAEDQFEQLAHEAQHEEERG